MTQLDQCKRDIAAADAATKSSLALRCTCSGFYRPMRGSCHCGKEQAMEEALILRYKAYHATRDFILTAENTPAEVKALKPQPKLVRISVRGGVAYVDKCPKGLRVIIKDYDNEEG